MITFATKELLLKEAKRRLAMDEKFHKNSSSDLSYWSTLAELEYNKAVIKFLEASKCA